MITETVKATAEDEIRELVENWLQAIRVKDINALMSHYAADILTLDIVPPLQYQGIDAYRKNWEAWFSTFCGAIGYEIRNLNVPARDEH